jgi:phosphate starvation-inducible protein PhoH
VIESVDEPEPVTEFGVKVGVAPEAVRLKLTLLLKPLLDATLTV